MSTTPTTTPAITVRSLADFKRFLALPGATVQVTRNDWMDPAKTTHPVRSTPEYWAAKQVQRLQAKTVQFTSGSWLQFPKAAHVRFTGDTVTLCMDQDGTFRAQLVYQLTAGGARAKP